MSDTNPTLAERFADEAAIGEACGRPPGMLAFHKAMGNPMATWVDGQVVWVQPEDIRIDDEPSRDAEPSAWRS